MSCVINMSRQTAVTAAVFVREYTRFENPNCYHFQCHSNREKHRNLLLRLAGFVTWIKTTVHNYANALISHLKSRQLMSRQNVVTMGPVKNPNLRLVCTRIYANLNPKKFHFQRNRRKQRVRYWIVLFLKESRGHKSRWVIWEKEVIVRVAYTHLKD